MILFARYVATPRRSVFSVRSDNSQSYPHQISRSLDHHNARAQDAPERRAVRAKVSCSQAKTMAFPKLALLLALAVGARAADDDQVVVGQTFMAGAIDPTSGSTGWALTSHGISEKLFTVDKDGNIVGQVADSVERVSDNVWEVTLKDGINPTSRRLAASAFRPPPTRICPRRRSATITSTCLCGNQPVRRVRSRCRVDGVEDDPAIQHERMERKTLISTQVRVQVQSSRRALLRVQVRGLARQLPRAPGRQGREQGGRLGLGRLGRRSRPKGARRGGDGRPRGPRVLDASTTRPLSPRPWT